MAVPREPDDLRSPGSATTPLPPITRIPAPDERSSTPAKARPATPRDPGKTISVVLLVLGLLVMLYAVIVVGRALG